MDHPPKRIVYILRSQSDPSRHYVGVTSKLERRLAWHNSGRNISTATWRPWRLLALIELEDEPTAVRFERHLKTGSGRAFALRHFSPVASAREAAVRSASGSG